MNRYLENVAVRRVVAMVLLASAWEVLSRIGVINPFYAPAPSEILRVVSSLFIEGTIYNHLEATFVAALAGLVIGLALLAGSPTIGYDLGRAFEGVASQLGTTLVPAVLVRSTCTPAAQ